MAFVWHMAKPGTEQALCSAGSHLNVTAQTVSNPADVTCARCKAAIAKQGGSKAKAVAPDLGKAKADGASAGKAWGVGKNPISANSLQAAEDARKRAGLKGRAGEEFEDAFVSAARDAMAGGLKKWAGT